MSLISFKPPYKMRTISLMLVIGFIVLFSQACSQDQGPSLALYPTQIPPTQEPIEIDPLSTVTFQVDIPPATPTNQPILLSLLDEVTGLGLKISRREMQKVGESTYSITLPFPVGANNKYRYAGRTVISPKNTPLTSDRYATACTGLMGLASSMTSSPRGVIHLMMVLPGALWGR